MNRTRTFAALLVVLFLGAVGVGVVLGDEDRPTNLVAASVDEPTTTTSIARTTTTKLPATTTTKAPTTTARPTPTTTPRRVIPTSVYVPTTSPTTTTPPTPPTTAPPPTVTTTTLPNVDLVLCAQINSQYDSQGLHDDPSRVALLKSVNCPPYFWD
jgi:hypothetical protein